MTHRAPQALVCTSSTDRCGSVKDVLDQPVTSAAFRIGEPVERTVPFRVFDPVIQVSLFLVAKCFPVTDQELKIARVRLVNGGVINFVDDAVAQREPDSTTRMIGSAKTFLGAGCPTRRDTGRAEGNGMFRWNSRWYPHKLVGKTFRSGSIVTLRPKTIAPFECVRIISPARVGGSFLVVGHCLRRAQHSRLAAFLSC